MKNKTRKQKQNEYNEKYKGIPINLQDRLEYMYEKYNISEKKAEEIIQKRYEMMSSLMYYEFNIILYENPEGAKRPRFSTLNRKTIAAAAMSNPQFIHVYSPNAKEDNVYMKRLMGDELNVLNNLIYTPCIVEYNAYIQTPASLNTTDTFLAEIGLERPIVKPDWDNIGKKYSDMYNHNVWMDDSLVIGGIVNKYYSILPRIEINLKYLNMLYNRYQYNSMKKKTEQEIQYFGG